MKVFVYYNLRKHTFSVKALEGPNKGRVILHTDEIYLKDCTFKVSEAGRQRVLKEKHKNVHAGIQGETFMLDEDMWFVANRFVKYNPYYYSTFVEMLNDDPVYKADYVSIHISDNRPVICMGYLTKD